MRRVVHVPVAVLAFMLGGALPLGATTIRFQATDLPDVPGGDLWQYEYFLDGADLLATQGFAVFFDGALYSTIGPLPPPLPVEWDGPVVADPDLVLDSDGYYDVLALVDNPAFTGPFTVGFVWRGAPGKAPGSQPFEVYQLDAEGTPVPFERGVTVPVRGEVPEPSTLFLLAAGAAAGRTMLKRRGGPGRPSTVGLPRPATAGTHRLE